MNNLPTLDELMEKVDSRYTLVVVAAKRARALTESGAEAGDGPVAGKPVTAALVDIFQDKVKYKRTRSGIK
ncbi:MAG: DNA-directed RNA polymerase subunit omega [Pelotomaculum thermopropionicum]|uniref:DNA-directed RNA polymerase subunit omega n=1 Tax=Pelotomaculum thermopropionicum TaxID=110500 RepID=A0A101HV05_9FIRM|nr:MAG: DNA-directed RNA polymerase subunit omega [Pelotomaculum thermopropionicum]